MLNNFEIFFWKKMIVLMGKRGFIRVAISASLAIVLLFVFLTSLLTYEFLWSNHNGASAAVELLLKQNENQGFYQHNTLVIIVDQLSMPRLLFEPKLRGVWLVASTSTAPRLTLLPIFPNSLQGGLQLDLRLASNFSLKWDNRPVEEFFDFLVSRNIRWDNYVLLDETALLNLVGLSGGVYIDHYGLVDDLVMIENLTISTQQPQGYAILANSICNRTWDLFQRADSKDVVDRLSGHLYSDLDWRYLVIGWMNMRDYGASFNCEFPTLSYGLAESSYLYKGGD
jgi:hypothetical protein